MPAPVTGIGIIPGGAAGSQAADFTRRAFVPVLIPQTRNTTPTIAAIFASAKPATGGIDSVTVPMQGGAFVTTQSTDYSGKFAEPENLSPGVNAQWPLKAIITPIPFLGMEGLIQWDAAVIPILAARMNDAGNSAAEYLSTQLWTNATYGSQDMDGLPLIGATTGTYAGLSRTDNSWLRGNVYHAGNVNPTRAILNKYIVGATKAGKGEKPDFAVTGPGTWSKLSEDFIGVDGFQRRPGDADFDKGRAGFPALEIAGVPIYFDPAYGVEGTLYMWKRKYLSLYIHQAAAWAFTGFQSTLANFQLGYVGALVTVLELVEVKPQTFTTVDQLLFDADI